MKKYLVSQIIMGVFLVFVFCLPVLAQDVNYNAMPGTDFTKYKTYKWVAVEGATAPDQITDTNIKQAIDSELSGKGLTKTDGDTVDMWIGYQLAVNQEKQWTAYGGMGGVRYGYSGMGTATSSTITVGTLVLNVYDPAAKQQIWVGSATKTLDPKADPEKRQKNLQKAMAKMLKNYPPPPPKK